TAFSRGRQNLASARARKAAEPRAESRRARYLPGRPHREPVDSGWALPLPTIDGPLVARSARAIERYGPDFAYSHFVAVPKAWQAAGLVAGAGALFAAAQLPPARRVLLQRVPAGQGPSEQKRADSWFTVTFVGTGGGRRVVTRVSGGDPGYDETAKMLAESALSLAFDDLPVTSGQVTTAAAMGDALLERLQRAGIRFELLQS
ncbi:MAG TPA: saccharopine dehydrogenase, partial [Jatrophihabitantaceae bacterium]|nr:saccharopine dehydrogenase [Jatrophihabitantaceae bacterium]